MKQLFYWIMLIAVSFTACNSEEQRASGPLDQMALGEGDTDGYKTITFLSKDSLEVTADLYPNEEAKSLIILCHQADFSRGIYRNIAKRLVDSGYACLAIDQRSGREVYGVVNETNKRALELGKPTDYKSARQDVEAAIDYVSANSTKQVYLWGSSYSASLALMIGAEDDRVKRIVAFSPGEYFDNQSTVRNSIFDLTTPVFITSSAAEYDMVVAPLVNVLPTHNALIFKPELSGDHGSKALFSNAGDETWEALFGFL